MASIKVKFRPSTLANQEGTIAYQITQDRKTRQIPTNHHLYPAEWNCKHSRVIAPQGSERESHVSAVREQIRCDIERLSRIVHQMEKKGLSFTADDIVNEYDHYTREYTLFNFMERIILKLKQNGKIRTSETYSSALSSFRKFRRGKDLMLDSLNSEIMEAYEAWHQQRGVTPNTISFYNRILRAVYNRAVDQNIIEGRNPFRHVYTGIDKTVKRALPLSIIKKINAANFSSRPSLDYARDMFLMSFMLRGMSFIDMAYLRKSDLKNGYITYRRRKTGQRLTIAWTKEMQAILDKYPENRTEYLLPIIKNPGTNERYTYRNVAYNINHNLKTIARWLGVTIPLTLYVARHSWASAAKSKGIPLSIISEGMGHDSESTTQIYLASIDSSIVDQANKLIINSI